MEMLLAIAAVSGSQSTLQLAGDGRILFGTDRSTAATLTASCAAARPTLTRVRPAFFVGFDPNATVDVLLGNIAPDCLGVSDWRTTPCARLHPDDEAITNFYCHFAGASASATTGPTHATTTVRTSGGQSFGYMVNAACPLPSYQELITLGPYDGSQPTYPINVSVSFWSPQAPALEFAGMAGGNLVEMRGLPAPPPPSPPATPPRSASAVYIQWGRSTCTDPSSAQVYAGWAAGSDYSGNTGGTSSFLCMAPNPQYSTQTSPHDNLRGVEYERAPNQNFDAACSVCQQPSLMQTYVQWGRGASCLAPHVTLYSGYAASGGHGNAGRNEMVCLDMAHDGHASSSSSNDNGALFYPTQVTGGAADLSGYVSGRSIGCSVCGVPANTGAVYIQWGRSTCTDPSSAQVYAGWAAGSDYSGNTGGTSSFLCMAPNPQYSTQTSPHDNLRGVEYERAPNQNFDAACSVCQQPSLMQTYVQWGRGASCLAPHVTLYSGYAASGGHGNAGRNEMVCLDMAHDGHASSSSSNDNGALFYPTQVTGGAADLSGYVSGRSIGCSVCAIVA